MIRSMTGYGRADFQLAGSSFDVEAKSVNHRYLDARAKLPRPLSDHDGAVFMSRLRGRRRPRSSRSTTPRPGSMSRQAAPSWTSSRSAGRST